jgi:two-component system, NarL family, nitrate/nitrite response regulator NarL
MTRILLCVGEPILVKGLEHLLRQVEGFELLPTCSGVTGLMKSISKGAAPDLVLLDLAPNVTYAVMADLKRITPDAKILLRVNSASAGLACQAMGLGVRGILRKELPPGLQVKCLQKVLQGELWFEKASTDNFSSSCSAPLTGPEAEVVSLLAQGLNNREIAATLKVSAAAVKVDLSRLFEKVGVKDRFELALFGLKNLTTQPAQGEHGIRWNAQADGNGFLRGLRSLLLKGRESAGAAEQSGGVRPEAA